MQPRLLPSALCVAVVLSSALTLAGEPDRWAGHRDEMRQRMEELAEAEARGDVDGEELEQLNRYWATHLRRCDMNAVESARYSAAEIQLQRGNATAAVAALQKVLAAKPRDELLHLTHFNLAEVHRRRLDDSANATKHYRLVGGHHRHRARYYMLRMLVEAGNIKEAAALLEDAIKKATEKGETLALLHRLATLYKHRQMADQALAIYQRIAKEFTDADVEKMRKAAIEQVQTAVQRITQLRERDEWEEAERLERGIHLRARELLLGGRWDELRAYQRAAEKGFRALERHERRMDGQNDERPDDDKRPAGKNDKDKGEF
ncbi:hypothetical protein HQ576_10490 [bacterium]|nr:hypothetical protein [bacterium]